MAGGIPITMPFDLANASPLDKRLISTSTEERNQVSFRYRGMWHWTIGQGFYFVDDNFAFQPFSALLGSAVEQAVLAYLTANPPPGGSGGGESDFVALPTIAAMNALPLASRKWGKLAGITSATDALDNGFWELVQGHVDNNLENNANWKQKYRNSNSISGGLHQFPNMAAAIAWYSKYPHLKQAGGLISLYNNLVLGVDKRVVHDTRIHQCKARFVTEELAIVYSNYANFFEIAGLSSIDYDQSPTYDRIDLPAGFKAETVLWDGGNLIMFWSNKNGADGGADAANQHQIVCWSYNDYEIVWQVDAGYHNPYYDAAYLSILGDRIIQTIYRDSVKVYNKTTGAYITGQAFPWVEGNYGGKPIGTVESPVNDKFYFTEVVNIDQPINHTILHSFDVVANTFTVEKNDFNPGVRIAFIDSDKVVLHGYNYPEEGGFTDTLFYFDKLTGTVQTFDFPEGKKWNGFDLRFHDYYVTAYRTENEDGEILDQSHGYLINKDTLTIEREITLNSNNGYPMLASFMEVDTNKYAYTSQKEAGLYELVVIDENFAITGVGEFTGLNAELAFAYGGNMYAVGDTQPGDNTATFVKFIEEELNTVYKIKMDGSLSNLFPKVEPVKYMIEGTYAEIKLLKDNQTLKPGMKYKITDFRSFSDVHGILQGIEDTVVGDIEPLILTAIEKGTFYKVAYSPTYNDIVHYSIDGEQPIWVSGDSSTYTTGRIDFRHSIDNNVSAHFDWRIQEFARFKLNTVTPLYTLDDNGIAGQIRTSKNILFDYQPFNGASLQWFFIAGFSKSNLTKLVDYQGFEADIMDFSGSSQPQNLVAGNLYCLQVIPTNTTGIGTGKAILLELINLHTYLQGYVFSLPGMEIIVGNSIFKATSASDYQKFKLFNNGSPGANVHLLKSDGQTAHNIVIMGQAGNIRFSGGCEHLHFSQSVDGLHVETGYMREMMFGNIYNLVVNAACQQSAILGGDISNNRINGQLTYSILEGLNNTTINSELSNSYIGSLYQCQVGLLKKAVIMSAGYTNFGFECESIIAGSMLIHVNLLSKMENVVFGAFFSHATISVYAIDKYFIADDVPVPNQHPYTSPSSIPYPRIIDRMSPDGTLWESKTSNAGVVTLVAATE